MFEGTQQKKPYTIHGFYTDSHDFMKEGKGEVGMRKKIAIALCIVKRAKRSLKWAKDVLPTVGSERKNKRSKA